MKNLIKIHLIFLCFFFLLSCKEEYSYEIENEICDCYYKKGDSLGLDFKQQIKQAENQLILEGVLKDSTSKSFVSMYQSVVDSGEIWFCHKNETLNLNKLFSARTKCQKQYDGLLLANSKKQRILKESIDSMTATSYIILTDVVQAYLDVLDTQDYDHPFYREGAVLGFYRSALSCNGIGKRVNLPKEINLSKEEKIEIELYIQSDSVLKVNGQIVDRKDLNMCIKNIIDGSPENYVLNLNAEENVIYGFVMNLLTETNSLGIKQSLHTGTKKY